MKLLWLACLFVCVFSAEARTISNDIEGYYWRDFTGNVPHDALIGGSLPNRTITFIGQVLFPNRGMIIPGEINPNTKLIYYEYYGAEFTAKQDVKILCTNSPENFTWVRVHAHDSIYSVLGENTSLVVAGHEGSHPLIIGRANDDSGERIGKVVVSREAFDGFYFRAEGNELSPKRFEVLVYNSAPKREDIQKENEYDDILVLTK